jgi:hypothetical protein
MDMRIKRVFLMEIKKGIKKLKIAFEKTFEKTFCFFKLLILVSQIFLCAFTDEMIFKDDVNATYRGRDDATFKIKNLDFADLPPEHWAKESVVRVGALEIIKGGDGVFRPNDLETRRGFIRYIINLLNLEFQITDEEMAAELGVEGDLDSPASREEIASMIVRGVNAAYPNVLTFDGSAESVYAFADWEDISSERQVDVEILTSRNITQGFGGNFWPRLGATRAEVARFLRNLDSVFYDAAGIDQKSGTVGGIIDSQSATVGSRDVSRKIYARNSNGNVDILEFYEAFSPKETVLDAVVLKNGTLGGLSTLAEGDEIEYLVKDGEILYVEVKNSQIKKSLAVGKLKSVDYAEGVIEVVSSAEYADEKSYRYKMHQNVYDGEITFPFGSFVELELENDMVRKINFLGERSLVAEIRGVVSENNKNFGYLKFINNSGYEQILRYRAEAPAAEVKPGDVAYMRVDGNGYIKEISAKSPPKEIKVAPAKNADSVIKGKLSLTDSIQKKFFLKNARELTPFGWKKYLGLQDFKIDDDTEFYHNDKKITLDYATKNLKDAEAYAAVYLETARKISFRDGADIALYPDSVAYTFADGSFRMISREENIKTDDGAIIIKNGILTDARDVRRGDYATTVLNDGAATVIFIKDPPGYEKVTILRARFKDENSVYSIAVLDDFKWKFSPVQREFNLEDLPDAVIEPDKAYYVVADGDKAIRIIDAPFAQEQERGTLLETGENELIFKNAVLSVFENPIIVKENKLIRFSDLKYGDQIRALTKDETAYILIVEKW